ncbi:MAG: 6-phosphogluconolactonase [Rhodoglobus sp.]
MTSERQVIVHPDKFTLATAVAHRFIDAMMELIAERGEASVVLTGGTMGAAVLEAINASPMRDDLDWSRVTVWWGDERWLPAGHADRNETQSRAALLDHIALDPARVHPYATSDSGIDLVAASVQYADQIAAHTPSGSSLPDFDITFLGMGPDGHIASLFPDRAEIREDEKSVVPVRNSPKPPPERLSLTLAAINSSSQIWLVASGADKAAALGLTLAGASPNEVPAAGVEGRETTIFFIDGQAAAHVPENLIMPGEFWTEKDEDLVAP